MNFRGARDITAASGTQEFEVSADSILEALEKFKNNEGLLVCSDCEVIDLGEWDLDSIWEEPDED